MWTENAFLMQLPAVLLKPQRKKKEENIKEILGHGHFMRADKKNCTIEKDDNSYFIADETDDYWEHTYIRVKELID